MRAVSLRIGLKLHQTKSRLLVLCPTGRRILACHKLFSSVAALAQSYFSRVVEYFWGIALHSSEQERHDDSLASKPDSSLVGSSVDVSTLRYRLCFC